MLPPEQQPINDGSHMPSVPESPHAASAPEEHPHAPSAPPMQHSMDIQPWEIGPQNVYRIDPTSQALGLDSFHVPAAYEHHGAGAEWFAQRRKTLMEWGQKRERRLHRRPAFLMDQLVSGSGFYPPRLLDDSWFTDQEKGMISQLEGILDRTHHGHLLAKDMLTPRLFDCDVRIVLDNSGSMQLDMLGQVPVMGFNSFGGVSGGRGFDIEQKSPENSYVLQRTLQQALPQSCFSGLTQPSWSLPQQQSQEGGLSPFHRRWFHARDAMRSWMQIYSIMGIDPPIYLLNTMAGLGRKVAGSQLEEVFKHPPQGSTPMSEAILQAISDHRCETKDRTLLLLVITDGEADNMQTFNRTLDEAQNNVYGDVQICLLGLSLVKRDIEWFENEECDETRIRTVEAFEVEQRQIMLREVVRREGNYNFAMHTYRVLLTNYFPADYDYEAPLQNLRHRLYITIHGRDRWWGLNNSIYWLLCSQLACSACFLATGCHCAGWCQGNDCGKCQKPELIESMCGGEE